MSPTAIVAYVLLFAGTGVVFVLAALAVGRLVRPKAPSPEKEAIYECGEPTIGPGFVQFDLRFYVVALVFLIFDVEAAFFFPWAAVFGSVARMSDPAAAAEALEKVGTSPSPASSGIAGAQGSGVPAGGGLTALGVPASALRGAASRPADASPPKGAPTAGRLAASCSRLAAMALADIAVFFGVLLVGFAYIWKEGDLNWVRATGQGAAQPSRAYANLPTA